MNRGLQSVRAHIREKFLGVHGDCRTKEQRQADQELRATLETEEDISIDICTDQDLVAPGVQLIEFDEEVGVEWVNLETDVDAETCLRDAIQAHQHTSTDEQSSVYYIEPPVESVQTLIEEAMKHLEGK